MTCIAELGDYSDFFIFFSYNDSFLFFFSPVGVVPDRVAVEVDLSLVLR